MKRQNWILAIIISIGISLIAISPRLIRMDKFELGFTLLNVFYNFIFCLSCWIGHTFFQQLKKKYFINSNLLVFGVLTIAAIASTSFLYDWLFSFITDKFLQFPEISGDKRKYMLLLRGILISGLYYFITYYLHILSEKQKSSIEIERLKQAQLAANLSSLKEQLSPHFLFNTLNTLSSLTQEKNVKDFVSELANVYRYVLQYKELDTATIQQELSFIESYLYIIKTRLEDAIQVNINVDNAVMHAKIPPLTLQLLIENAIKHNIASSSKQLKINIQHSAGNFLVISNNFQPKTSTQLSTGIGLDNVMKRYQLLFNKEIIIEKSDVSFTVKLPIV